jgi:hypothetical protein
MNPLSSVLDIGSKLIDRLVPDKGENARMKADLIQQGMNGELRTMEAAVSIILAEAGGNWLQRSWRPIIMLWFALLIGMYWFGLAPDYLVKNPAQITELFSLMKIGIGGYVVGRSAEKVSKNLKNKI